ncbi:Vacuolar protein 8 [Smittium culicis]|uniref:Vacuolar protein 8 n=1 Tax=Smittium culicis TaxID=133412 RepID=A0A1R1XHH2_9FUNG|nr:Vacuolar protein 8 [Smittium culicis]
MSFFCNNIISRLCCLKPSEQFNREHEPLFADVERQAVNQLIDFFENRSQVNFYEGEPLRALSTLAYSGHFELQRSAAIAFSEVSEADVRPVSRETLDPILYLLQSPDFEVLRSASAALGNLAVDPQNKILIVKIGGLEPLIRQMLSPNKEAQCNAVGCITNLATAEENKSKIAKSGALIPLSRLAKSHDIRVQKNATGALLNMTHSPENRMQLVSAGAVRVLVELLDASDSGVQYYSTTAISNIAVDENSRAHLHQTEPSLVPKLIRLMDEPEANIRCQAALALRNLASDDEYQRNIVINGGLRGLKNMLISNDSYMVLASVACLRNLSIHPGNESALLNSGFLMPLVQLLSSPTTIGISSSNSEDNYVNYGEIACHSVSTLRNLSASSDNTKLLLVEYGILPKIYSCLVNHHTTMLTKSEMTAALAVLALCDTLKEPILSSGFLEVLIPLTHATFIDVVGNSAAAIGNLSASVSDYSVFISNWYEPEGGLQLYLQNFLSSEGEPTFLQIGVWTILQLVESGNEELMKLIKSHDTIPGLLKKINTDYTANSQYNQIGDLNGGSTYNPNPGNESYYQVAALIQQVFKSLDLEL